MTAPADYVLPDGSLPETELRQQLSIAYVHMVATAAGCDLHRHGTDYDGVDLTVASLVRYSRWKSPRFDMQLKCTSQDVVGSDTVSWSLDQKKWEKLADPDRYDPALIGILVVPPDVPSWLEHDETMLLTRSVMYWAWGAELGAFPAGQQTSTVHFQKTNRFTAVSLLEIMEEIGTASR